MSFIRRLILFGFMATFVLVWVGCGSSLPKEIKEKAEAVPDSIASARVDVESRESAFLKIKSSSEYGDFFARYDEQENWASHFTVAYQKLDNASGTFERQIKPILDNNKPEEVELLQTQLDRIHIAIKEAREESAKPSERMAFLLDARDHADEWVVLADQQTIEIGTIFRALAQTVAEAQTTYPEKQDDLTTRLAPSQRAKDTAENALLAAQQELIAENPNYAVLGDSITEVAANLSAISSQDVEVHGKIDELGRSYSKTLVDMDIKYFVVIGRTSWDNWSDFNTNKDYEYAVIAINEETYEYIASLPEGQVLAKGKNANKPQIETEYWQVLQINGQENWPRNHDDAEYWLSELDEQYFHKYLVTENAEQTESDWVEVTEVLFEQHETNLGMDIFSKPFGMYEEEALTVAAPPGMAYVGNDQYGKWEKDDDGDEFWSWYGRYAFYSYMFGGGHYYYYNSWYGWNTGYRGHTPYYGTAVGGGARYGTYSQNSRSQYANSRWGNSGGFETQTGSVRGGGSSSRGGGPGGRGK